MIENMLNWEDNHPLLVLIDEIVSTEPYVLGEGEDPEDSHEYVNARGACTDFLYRLNETGRLSETPGNPVSERTVREALNDLEVTSLKTELAYHGGYGNRSDGYGILNISCLNRLHEHLVSNGYIKYYEKIVITTTKVEL